MWLVHVWTRLQLLLCSLGRFAVWVCLCGETNEGTLKHQQVLHRPPTQVSPSELQDVFQETSSNIFQINANVVTLEKNLPSLGTSRDTAELRQSLHSTQQQTNKLITSTSQLVKQLTDIISGSSRQDRLRLTRLKTELSDSLQQYGDLQKKIADRSRALLPPAQKDRKQSLQTSFSELVEEGPLFGAGEGIEGDGQAFLSEISEEDVEILRQREEALLQIEMDIQHFLSCGSRSANEQQSGRLMTYSHSHIGSCHSALLQNFLMCCIHRSVIHLLFGRVCFFHDF
ncbi:t-SNARE domain-containing protein 1-like isoform X3 [Carassius gibelio]|uniref:t-SNARE domain-containing protein 1-like isoform X3 n=1 Tax=Carassius gibelio TaxID=101364 RepID=UPI0022776476|nr:t-SNARE domain-containing protein 1-like isoform X3 [Carassius gibelio]